MSRLASLAAAALVGCLPANAATQAQRPPATDNPLTSVMDRAVDAQARAFFGDACHVGLSAAVVSADKPRFYNYGSTTKAAARLPSRTSVYEIASVTKTFTGALAAAAVTDGRMTLDADFRRYLPGAFPNLTLQGRPVTLRDLASHTSGLQRDIPDSDALLTRPDFATLAVRLRAQQRGYDRRRYLASLRQVRLRSTPGATEAYSNAGMMVIAFGLERVYGEPYDRLLRRLILSPLRLTATTFAPDRAMAARRAQGYSRLGSPMPPLPTAEPAAWGLWSDAQDMARYVAWHLDPHNPVVARAHAAIGPGKALIWNMDAGSGEALLWHGGGSFGSTSQLVLFPASGEGYVLLANDACEGTEDRLKQMAVAVHNALARPAGRPG